LVFSLDASYRYEHDESWTRLDEIEARDQKARPHPALRRNAAVERLTWGPPFM
jgi:hypothetical protein